MRNSPELSNREIEILQLVSTGSSNKEIALKLNISSNTVKVHLRNVFAKIGVMSRTEATLYAIEHHIVETPGNNAELTAAGDSAETPCLQKNRRILLVRFILLLLGTFPLIWYLSTSGTGSQTSTGNPTQPPPWQSHAPMPEARAGMAAVPSGSRIYPLGGETESGITASTLRYDNSKDEWKTLAAKPTAVKDIQAVMISEQVYIPGGLSGTSVSNVLEVYDLRTDTWETAAPLPEPRSGYALVALEGRIYLFGGWDGSQVVNTVYVFDPLEGRWSKMNPMAIARAYLKAINVDNKIYIFGGWNGKEALPNADLYIPARDKPGDQAWVALEQIPEEACRFSVANVSGYIILIGLKERECLTRQDTSLLLNTSNPYYFSYQTQTGQWFTIEPSPVAIGSDSAIVAIENKVFTIGGQYRGVKLDDTQSFLAIYYASLPILLSP